MEVSLKHEYKLIAAAEGSLVSLFHLEIEKKAQNAVNFVERKKYAQEKFIT